MDLTRAPDSDLIASYLSSGSEEAFEVIYHRYNPVLINFLKSLGYHNTDEVEDILQLTWERVFRYLSEYKPEFTLQNWLYKIARNRASSYVRDVSERHGGQVFFDDIDDHADTLVFDNRNGHHIFDPRETFMIRETLDRVLAVIDTFPQQDRDIMHYVCIEGLTWKETVELMETTQGALRCSLTRSRKKLSEFAHEI